MKTYVIVALSIYILSAIIGMFASVSEESDRGFVVSLLITIMAILALVFTCVGWN